MDLFEQLDHQPHNLLPQDGIVHYYGPIMSREEADDYFDALMHDVAWQHDQAVIYGKAITTRRRLCQRLTCLMIWLITTLAFAKTKCALTERFTSVTPP